MEGRLLRQSVRGLIYQGQAALIVEHAQARQWILVGGMVESGELTHQALVREVREETQLDVLVYDYVQTFPKPAKQAEEILFVVRSCAGQILINEESLRYAWVLPEDLDRYDIRPRHRHYIHLGAQRGYSTLWHQPTISRGR